MDEIDEEDEGEDPELRRIKMQRLRQLKLEHNQRLENLGKGHGQLLDITQDEFIGAMTTSMTTVCLFYHKDFQRCEVMNHHLQKLAQRHIESKFVKIDAEKAPFFVEKVRSRVNQLAAVAVAAAAENENNYCDYDKYALDGILNYLSS